MFVDKKVAELIDALRAAAREHGAVYDLLIAVREGILLDNNGNKEIVGDKTDIVILNAAQIAASFSEMDRGE